MRRVVATLCVLAALGATAWTAHAAGLAVDADRLTVVQRADQVPTKQCTLSASAADAYVNQAAVQAGTNFGTATAMDVRSESVLGLGLVNLNRRALVRFALGPCGIPAGAEIEAATLGLRLTTAPAASRTHAAARVTSAWTETTVTWNTMPTTAATDTDTAATGTTVGATVEWDVAPDVRAFVAGTATNQGWMVRDGTEGAATAVQSAYATREHATPAQRPALSIEYRD